MTPSRAAAATLLGLVVLALGLGPTALSHGTGADDFATTHLVTIFDGRTPEGPVAWFMVDGGDKPNPAIRVHPGESIVLVFINAGGQPHRLWLGAPIDNGTDIVAPGKESSMHFDVPFNISGPIRYLDPDWAANGAVGDIRIVVDAGPETTASPAPAAMAVLALVLGAAIRVRRARYRTR